MSNGSSDQWDEYNEKYDALVDEYIYYGGYFISAKLYKETVVREEISLT